MNRKTVIDDKLVADGLLFTTAGYRCRYLGTPNWDKPRWLKENRGRYQRIEDVVREPAQLGQPDDVVAGRTEPNREPSSRDIAKDARDDDKVSLVGTVPEHRSPSSQTTCLSAPPVNDGATQTELLPRTTAATSETPLETFGYRRRRGGCQRKKRELPPGTSKPDRKPSHESMRLVLDSLTKCPIIRMAAREAGLHHKTIERWLKCSRAGHDGYEIRWHGFPWRFHEAYEVAVDEAYEALEGKLLDSAFEVVYKTDLSLVELGCQGEDAYARDEYGSFIPEGIRIRNKRLTLIWLGWKRPERYGKPPKRRKRGMPQSGGVLVIGQATKKLQTNTAASVKARKWKARSRIVRKSKA